MQAAADAVRFDLTFGIAGKSLGSVARWLVVYLSARGEIGRRPSYCGAVESAVNGPELAAVCRAYP
jgi:hypothetical protein